MKEFLEERDGSRSKGQTGLLNNLVSHVFDEAREHYKDALERKSKEHHFHFAMAKAYTQLGTTSEAIEHLRVD